MSEHPKIFSLEYYRRLYEVEERHWWSVGMREVAARLLDPPLGGRGGAERRVLDAGCGTGRTLSWLERYAPPERIVGIDLAWFALEFCRQRRLTRLSQASITQLPFPDATFDLVTCVDVLQHLPQDGSESAAFGEMGRVLKPGGYLYLRTNARQWLRETGGGHGHEHYHRYTRAELVQKITAAGFSVERLTHANSLLSFVAELKKLLKPSSAHQGGDKGLAIQVPKSHRLNTLLFHVMRWEADYLARPARRLPFGHSLVGLAKKLGEKR